MCVYLAPRWRRRSFVLVLILALLLLRADARTLRKLNVSQTTGNADSGLISAKVGVVTTNSTQSFTTVTTRAWNSGSGRDTNQPSNDKSVSFDSLVKVTTPLSILKHKFSVSSTSASMDHEIMTPGALRGKINTGDPKQGDYNIDDNDETLDDGSNNAGADSSSDSKSTNDETTSKTGTTNKAATPVPTLPTTLPSAQSTHAPPSRPDSVNAKMQGRSSSSSSAQSVVGKNSNFINDAKALENKTKSALSTSTTSRSLDQTLVVVIIGVVGAIGALLMVVSRKVLKEMGDDKDLEDSSIF